MTSSSNTDIEVEVNNEISENQSETKVQNKLPDGGWAWRIVFASFVCNIVLGIYLTHFKVNFFSLNLIIPDGITFSYGLLLVPLLEYFDSNRSIMSNGGSFVLGFYTLSSAGTGILIKKIGCRNSCILGCIVSGLGIGLSVFSPNSIGFLLLYGTIGGIGIGMMYLPTMVVISEYFDNKVIFTKIQID